MPASGLGEAVSSLIDRHRDKVPASLRPELESISRRLQEPLRIAVIGRVKAGKSTLVNALLGQRVAPTDVSECTKLVTWFHYGHPQRLEVELRDGRRAERPLADDGLLPDEVGFPLAEIAALHVYLANAALQSFTLIDTPGLGSVHPDYSASTEELLAASRSTRDAAGRADAVVYLMNQVILEDELEALVGLGHGTAKGAEGGDGGDGGPSPDAVRSLGLLGRVDQLGDGRSDPWPVGEELAAHYAELLRDQVSSVLPVMGLLAETTEAALLTEQDAQALATLARLPAGEVTKLTWTADRFRSAEAPVGRPERERLLDLLALHGVRAAIWFVQQDVIGAAALRRALSEACGVAPVKQALALLAAERDQVLKTRSALHTLDRISYAPGLDPVSAGALRSDVDRLRTSPVMHPIAELEAWHAVAAGEITLPESLQEDLRCLVTEVDPAGRVRASSGAEGDVREAVKAGLLRWRRFLNAEAAPAQQGVARTVLRSYQLLWSQLS